MSATMLKLLQSGLGIVLSSIFGIALIKIIALKSGPETLGYFGVFRQFFQLLTVIFTLGSGFAVIEGLSKTVNKKLFIETASSYTFWVCLVLSAVILMFNNAIAELLFNTSEENHLIWLLPFIIFTVAYTLLMKSIYSAEGKLIYAGIFGSFTYFFMFLVSLISTELSHLYFYGSLLSFTFALIFFKERMFIKPKFKFSRIITFEKTAISTAITGITGFFSFLIVRAICLKELGPDDGGLLESSWSLINYTVLIFLTSLSTYYLPQISERPDDVGFRKKFFLLINILSISSLLLLCLGKSIIIPVLFSDKFLPASNLLVIMSVGEYFKCLNYFFIFSLIGISRKRAYLIIDTVANLLFIILAFTVPTQTLETFGYIYVTYQGIYLLGLVVLNYLYKIIPSRSLSFNLLGGLFIWGSYLLMASHI